MIDVESIKRSYKISDLSPNLKKVGRYFIGPCPICGGVDRFTVKPTSSGEVWFCRHCGNDKYNDVIELVKRINRSSFIEAVNILTNGDYAKVESINKPDKKVYLTKEVPDLDFQQKAQDIWLVSHERLIESLDKGEWNPYLAWLMNRGITPKEVRQFGLGYHPGGMGLAKGIVIPSFFNGKIMYLKVRKRGVQRKGRLTDKYRQLSGGKSKSLFNADAIQYGIKKVVVIEGEFDAMLLSRYVKNDTAVVTMGSTSQVPDFSEWGYLFAAVEEMYVAQDSDEAGSIALTKWAEKYPYSNSMKQLEDGMDVTDYWKKHGGNGVKKWLLKSGVLD